MKKKKILSVIAAVVVVASLAIGSLAYFTSQDKVTNKFSTVTTEDSSTDSGIKIEEKFDPTVAGKTLPGDTVQKEVDVKNTSNYDQLIRAKIEKVWKVKDGNKDAKVVDSYYTTTEAGTDSQGNTVDSKGNPITKTVVHYYDSKDKDIKLPEGAEVYKLDSSLIQLNFGSNLGSESNQWTKQTDANLGDDGGYYYYNEKLAGGDKTSNLLESVTLKSNASNIYKNLQFDVVVTSDGVQASNGAVSGWTTAPDTIKTLGGASATK